MKTPEHLQSPVCVNITPRLVSAILATGQKLPPGSKVVIIPPPPGLTQQRRSPKHHGTCHICGAKDYACDHIPGVPF